MKNFENAFASTLEIACKEEYFDTIETPAKKGWDEAKWEPTMIEPIDYIGQEKERISLLLPEARKGNVRAMSELGFLFLEYTNDVRAAVYWLSKAAKHDDAEALWHLASCYSDRRHKQCDARASLKLLKRAARLGHVPSMRRLGLYYEQAFSVPYDAKKAAGYYAQAAKQGDFESLYRLGRLYYMGRDIERDYAKPSNSSAKRPPTPMLPTRRFATSCSSTTKARSSNTTGTKFTSMCATSWAYASSTAAAPSAT